MVQWATDIGAGQWTSRMIGLSVPWMMNARNSGSVLMVIAGTVAVAARLLYGIGYLE